MDRQLLLVQELRRIATELGKTPSRDEWRTLKQCRDDCDKLFKTYALFVQAAGLEPLTPPRKRKIDNSIFVRSVADQIAQYEPAPYTKPEPLPSFAVISDIHWPFHCQRVIDAFIEYVRDNKPEWVILNGDAFDMYSHAKFPRSHNVFTPREEEQLAKLENTKFWERVREASPNSTCVQMMGNHDIRPIKRVMEQYPAMEHWIEPYLTSLFTFPGVQTIFNPRQELYLNANTQVFHGHRSQLGAHMLHTRMNAIVGHTHRGGVVYRLIAGILCWELNSGYAGDPLAKGLSYTAQKLNEWTHGFGAGDKYGARFISA